ncbi:MAG: hypothetical protein DI527_01560 [Chelatococcus sp.]|nr:MAG: hypothetical protein DI527_01560 [Chelatococcus sp.]
MPVFQQAVAAAPFQTPLALQPVNALEQMRATQALGLLPPWHFCSQSAFICEHDLCEALHPS